MHIRTKEDIEKENVLLRHKCKMLKIKYDMVNGALKKVNGLIGAGPLPSKIMKGVKYGH